MPCVFLKECDLLGLLLCHFSETEGDLVENKGVYMVAGGVETRLEGTSLVVTSSVVELVS